VTCGGEYDTPHQAFEILDITEAWYLRRSATCDSPFFWVRFNATQANQKLYISVIAPESDRFRDKLSFNGVLYGPGLPRDTLPIDMKELDESDVKSVVPEGRKLLQSPSAFESCSFVDNAVMTRFAKPINGRCMENLTLDEDYKDKLIGNATYYSWWLFSEEMRMPEPGVYYLVSWLTDRKTGERMTGKYEVTLGPWTWYGYASSSMLAESSAQGTTCQCAPNSLGYSEQNLERVGSPPAAMLAAELPWMVCSDSSKATPRTGCTASLRRPSISANTAIEWAGLWDLQNGTYLWTFYAQKKDGKSLSYPDPSMDVFIVSIGPGSELSGAEGTADAAMSREDTVTVSETTVTASGLGKVSATAKTKQTLMFSEQAKTQFTLDIAAKGRYAIFTQHLPTEFMANALECSSGACKAGTYQWALQSHQYGFDDSANTDADNDQDAGSPTSAEQANGADHDDHDHDHDHDHDTGSPTSAEQANGADTGAATPPTQAEAWKATQASSAGRTIIPVIVPVVATLAWFLE
jgi:hypothetical protein